MIVDTGWVPLSPSVAGMNRQDAFLANLDSIERIIVRICRRHLVPDADQDDFGSYAKLRLMEGDYVVFAKFQGRSSLTTYLTVVITNYFRDFRTTRWGRWRPSAEARRQGTIGLRLEALLVRDGYTIRQAITVLRSAGGELPDDATLFQLAARLQVHARPREVDAELAEQLIAAETTDAPILQEELDDSRRHAAQELRRALETLEPLDQLILRMHYLEGLSLADIARTLHIDQKPLYRRRDACLGQLRSVLEGRGVKPE
ncbi:MAG: sigma-70 family RNA polymerase sigma factor [Longimicrobiales bacterium]